MAKLPPIELLQATHVFPGTYHMKVIGSASDDFLTRVLDTVKEEMLLDRHPIYTTRETAGGRHVAVSLELHARTAEEVHQVYSRLLTLPGLILLL